MKLGKINIDQNFILVAVAVIVILVGSYLAFGSGSLNNILSFKKGLSNDEIAKNSIDYLNSQILKGQSTATLGEVSEESGLVKFKIKIGANEFDSYATKDGKLLFPQAFALATANATDTPKTDGATAATPKKTAADIKKVDKPVLEAYVVSRCPFGLQMQRVMADVVKNAPALASNMKVLYMGSVTSDGKSITSMHGDAEAKENLRQICIREEQNSKYWNYVSCQMKSAGQEVACEKSTGVDSVKLASCISDTSRGVAYAKEDFDLNTKYNVTGSPTLVMQDGTISEFDFGGRDSETIKTIICSAFNKQPGICSTKLNTSSAATSFSPTYTADTSGSAGNSGANGANCAPAS